MWILTSSALLASILVTGLSLPTPDDEGYDIPDVGVGGRRNQYYVLHDDGSFKYGYDTGDDAFESVKKHSDDRHEGFFGYRDPESGQNVRLDYETGSGGFVASGAHIPKPSQAYREAFASAKRRPPFVDNLASSDSDKSYDFGFSSDDHSRTEQSNSDGTVTGSYSFVDEFGKTRTYRYRAGKGIGFVIEGDGLDKDGPVQEASHLRTPQTPRRPTRPVQRTRAPTPVHKPRTHSAVQQTRTTGPVHTHRAQDTSRFRATQHTGGIVQTKTSDDGSYSFSYKADDHERKESADSDLNVEGSFSFVADDGERRTINYNSGSGTGFRAEGDHLPVAPEVPAVPQFGLRTSGTRRQSGHTQSTRRTHQFKQPQRQSLRTGSHVTKTKNAYFKPSTPTFTPSVRTTQFETANIQSDITPAGPYFFRYETSDHSRSESGDDNNEVEGEFTFIADDGVRRELKYEAGSDTGFVVDSDHLPVGAIVPGSPTGQPNGRLERVRSTPFVDPLANSGADASYNFEFDSDYYSRSESADEDGNIVGTYTMVDEDGNKITYRFRAGKGIGFETEEISRTRVTPPVKKTFRQHTPALGTTRIQQQAFPKPASQPRVPTIKSSIKPATPTHIPGFSGSFQPKQSVNVFPGFTLNQYDATKDASKYGYVLRFDDK